MQIETILAPHRTRCGVPGGSKKRVLETLAGLIANDLPILDANELFRRLIAREKLGSTGIGHGIAIPHCRIENCAGTVGALMTLSDPVDYDSIDSEPVDVVFALLVPEEAHDEHLQTLAGIAERLGNPAYLAVLRKARDDEALYRAALAADAS